MRRLTVLSAFMALAMTMLVASTATAAPKPQAPPAPSGFASEQVWNSGTNDWEPMVAADPSSNYVYQMTTRYGGVKACGQGMQHCIYFRASSNNGTTWGSDFNMCSIACKNVQA